jgi:hypothetical protein
VSRALGSAGAVHMPLEVINDGAGRMQISSIVIGFDGPPRMPAMPPGALAAFLPFQPTASRVFLASDALSIAAPLFWSSVSPSVEVALLIRRGDATVSRREEMVTAGSTSSGDHRRALFDATVPLKDLGAGEYLLVIQATRADGQKSERAVAFEVK